MGAKFYMCLLLVILVTSSVHCARLRSPQDVEKSPSFLYGRLFSDESVKGACCMSCGQPSCSLYPRPCAQSHCLRGLCPMFEGAPMPCCCK